VPAAPSLPIPYTLVELERAESALEAACRLAREGAEEGTLVHVREESAPRGRLGGPWWSAPGNLHCALVLEPEGDARAAGELGLIGVVALGTAVAGLLSPLVSLRYRWANDVLVNGAKAATVSLAGPATENGVLPWLVLGVRANVAVCPEETGFPATSLTEVEGEVEFGHAELLEGFAREFLAWINRWAEAGLGTVLEAWRPRAEGIGEPTALRLSGGRVEGTVSGVDEAGSLLLETSAGVRTVTLNEFFAVPAATK